MRYGLSGQYSAALLNYRILNRHSTYQYECCELSVVGIAARSILCIIVFNCQGSMLVDQRFPKKANKIKG